MQIPATDVPLFVTGGLVPAGRRQVLRAGLARGARARRCRRRKDKVTLDVAGFIRDERGFPGRAHSRHADGAAGERRRRWRPGRCSIRPA